MYANQTIYPDWGLGLHRYIGVYRPASCRATPRSMQFSSVVLVSTPWSLRTRWLQSTLVRGSLKSGVRLVEGQHALLLSDMSYPTSDSWPYEGNVMCF